MGERALKKEVVALLKAEELDEILPELRQYPERQLLKPLFSGLCSNDELTRWHAVTAMGLVVGNLADQDMEAARVVMRRFMWSLNDESGGIGWGVPEAMAEVLACHGGLAEEYAHILVSYMREDGFYLEYPPLQRGLMWGLGRLAEERPDLLRDKDAVDYLVPYLHSEDGVVCGLAARALGRLKASEAAAALGAMVDDRRTVRLYDNRRLLTTTVGALAGEALASLSG